jgi:hypothetical protein
VFTIYHHYLIRFVQSPSSSSNLPLEVRYSLLVRVLTAGLTWPIPTPPPYNPEDSLFEPPQKLYDRYTSGQSTAAQYQHLFDWENDVRMGFSQSRRVGKTTGAEREVISAFMEDEPGEREKKLNDEMERDAGSPEEWEEDGIVDRDGSATKLHPYDPRAVEFRERFRTWCVDAR